MNYLEIYGGAGGISFTVSVLTLLAWNTRLTKVEDSKQDKTACAIMHEFQKEVNTDRKKDVEEIKDDLKYIKERIDDVFYHVNGGKK